MLKAALHSIALVGSYHDERADTVSPRDWKKIRRMCMKSFLYEVRAGKGKERSRKQDVASL